MATIMKAAPKTGISATTPYTQRARYFDSDNAFNIEYPPVPAAVFVSERNAAFDAGTGSRFFACDQSAALGVNFPATSPLVLASYARIRGGESLTFDPRATVVLAYVIEGEGSVVQDTAVIDWRAGDVFSLPGGSPIRLAASTRDSILWIVTNEPELAFERMRPPKPEERLVEAAHFPAASIDEELAKVRKKLAGKLAAGLSVVFATEGLEERRNISPSFTLAMNQLEAGGIQIPHSHNSVAVSLAVKGNKCYSMVGGERKDWLPFVTMVTPPTSVHSHHNEGANLANWLIVQDGGLYYHCRTMNFRYENGSTSMALP
jgi:gentisate 1,2-dioxygenase